jgi:hypothetical protein
MTTQADVAGLIEDIARHLAEDIRGSREGRLGAHIATLRLLLDKLEGGQELARPRRGPGGRPPARHNLELADAIRAVLRTTNQPMAVGDILRRLKVAEVPIPGKGDTANLIAVMRRMPGVRRHDRGMYSLSE